MGADGPTDRQADDATMRESGEYQRSWRQPRPARSGRVGGRCGPRGRRQSRCRSAPGNACWGGLSQQRDELRLTARLSTSRPN